MGALMRNEEYRNGYRAAIGDVLAEFERPIRYATECNHEPGRAIWNCVGCLYQTIKRWTTERANP